MVYDNQSVIGMEDMFAGNFDERRKFGAADIMSTLGIGSAVSCLVTFSISQLAAVLLLLLVPASTLSDKLLLNLASIVKKIFVKLILRQYSPLLIIYSRENFKNLQIFTSWLAFI